MSDDTAMMTEDAAQRLGALRVIEITELLMLVGRENELGKWARIELTAEQVRQRLFAEMGPVRASAGAPPAPVMSAVEAAFAQRGAARGALKECAGGARVAPRFPPASLRAVGPLASLTGAACAGAAHCPIIRDETARHL